MEFVVVGAAKADFLLSEADEDALNEKHWAYMDRFASDLVARGPILSVGEAEDWMGSVHIIKADNRFRADRFAFDEPYWCAGQYDHLQVTRFENILQSTMWERNRDPDCASSWFARWMLPDDQEIGVGDFRDFQVDKQLVFAGYLVSDNGLRASGFLSAIDAATADIESITDRITDRLDLSVIPKLDRWRRGGRPIA
jgi:uncharacterized protein